MYTLAKAIKELKKVIDYLEENKSAWNEQKNLKLYEAAYYDYEEDYPLCYEQDFPENTYNQYNSFYWFCEDNYNMFLEWLAEENINKNILHYIGSTSCFTIGKYASRRLSYGISDILEDCYNFDYIDFTEDFKISIYGDWDVADEEVQAELEYIINNLYEDVKYRLEDIIKVANYIDNFKENQLEYFKEYLSYEELIV